MGKVLVWPRGWVQTIWRFGGVLGGGSVVLLGLGSEEG